jgi:hypothetical protein
MFSVVLYGIYIFAVYIYHKLKRSTYRKLNGRCIGISLLHRGFELLPEEVGSSSRHALQLINIHNRDFLQC